MIGRTISDQSHDEAAEWVARLAGESVDEADAQAFEAWIEADPENKTAYDAALATWLEFGQNAPAVLQGMGGARRSLRARTYVALGAAAAAAAVIAVVALQPPTPAAQDFATVAGQRRSLQLADGTRIELNGRTRITVRLRREAREVALGEGEAAFDVAHDPVRPFLIAAGDRTIRVVGTAFDVKRRAGHLTVSVARGAVEVAPAQGSGGHGYRLHPGDRLEHAEGTVDTRLAAIEPGEAVGWRTGRLVYRGQPLSEVVADLNAKFATPIRIEDPFLAAQPVSGVLVLDDESAVVRRLALLVSARAVPSGGGVSLQRAATPNR